MRGAKNQKGLLPLQIWKDPNRCGSRPSWQEIAETLDCSAYESNRKRVISTMTEAIFINFPCFVHTSVSRLDVSAGSSLRRQTVQILQILSHMEFPIKAGLERGEAAEELVIGNWTWSDGKAWADRDRWNCTPICSKTSRSSDPPATWTFSDPDLLLWRRFKFSGGRWGHHCWESMDNGVAGLSRASCKW